MQWLVLYKKLIENIVLDTVKKLIKRLNDTKQTKKTPQTFINSKWL